MTIPLRNAVVIALGLGAALAVSSRPTAGQRLTPPPPVSVSTQDPLADATLDELFFEGRVAEVVQRLDVRIERDSSDVEALWRAARASLVSGILETDSDIEETWFTRAGALGERAVALRDDDAEILYWAAASLGREALQHGPRTSAGIVQRVWDLTHMVLAIDPNHAGAHNILGKLNQEVMSLSGFERFIGRLLFRIDPLKEATWERAEHHHRTAVTVDPQTVLFGRDLGETLHAIGMEEEARDVWNSTLALPSTFPVDERFKDDIRRMMLAGEGG